MAHFLMFLLYAVYALVFGILAVVLKRKHTQFPDFRVGYHNKKAMESKEKWDRANAISGSLCAVFAVAALIAYFILYLQNANISTMIIAYFVYCAVTIPAVLILPTRL